MVERLIKLLEKEIDNNKYLINYQKINSKELFFIKDKLDMNRAKSVEHCSVTIYKDIDEGGDKYIGSATFKVSPSMDDKEIVDCINDTMFSATLVKNPVYKLVKPSGDCTPKVKTNINYENSAATLQKVIDLVYSIDKNQKANVNSMEIFLEDITTKIVNSEGVNEEFSVPKMIIELVVDCKGEKEEVELYDMIKVSDYNEDMLKSKIEADFINVEKRAEAKALSLSNGIPVIIKGEAVPEVFSYYTFKSDAVAIYKKYSQFKIDEAVQGEEIEGDSISITLMPEIPYSVSSRYIDDDGVLLKELPLVKDGKLLAYHGNNRYSQYCDVEVTGSIPNVKIHEGSFDYDEMLKDECLEVIGFSDFQMDSITGDFGGEIRLAIHHKEGKAIPVTGGSITGNIYQIHSNIQLSMQTDITGNCQHPKAIKFAGAKISS